MRLISSSISLATAAALLSACATLPQGTSRDSTNTGLDVRTRYVGLTSDAEVAEILASPLGEEAAVRLALFNDHTLRARYDQLAITEADLRATGLLPVSDGARTPEAGIALPVLDIFLIPLRNKQGITIPERIEIEVTDHAVALIADVRRAWTRLAVAKQAHNLAKMSENIARAAEKVAVELADKGNLPADELVARKIAVANAEHAVIMAESERREAREDLAGLLGVDLMGDWFVHNADPATIPADLNAVDMQAVMDNSLALASSKAEVARVGASHGITDISSILPDIDLAVSAERDDHQWEVGPSIEMPVPVFNFDGPKREKAEADVRAAQYEYAHSLVVTANRAALLVRERDAAHKLVKLLNEQVTVAADQAVAASLRQYNAMQTGVFGLLAIRENAVEARRHQLQGWQRYRNAEVAVDAARAGVILPLKN
ncbi:TolC family protein [Gimibacter soli]|uniref:TolC family protein n=1 Tax=Gimibacter soli TaxID=3024400 RepID=A0AAE9XXI6_9PROT|nr:TolC family protein [Gimibacter soli]WCL55494.1 TolC family protein [Gimibacter soli]